MNIIILDDDPKDRSALREAVQDADDSESRRIVEFGSGEDFLEAWEKGLSCDILFTDIELDRFMSGMEVARRVRRVDRYMPIVFVTNFASYACEGYTVEAMRYLMKPVNAQAVKECIELAGARDDESTLITVSTEKQTLLVPLKSIIYIEVLGHQLTYHTRDSGAVSARQTISYAEAQLKRGVFVRCHRSFIVNLKYVRKFRTDCVTLADGSEIPIGRKYARAFCGAFDAYYLGKGLMG